MNYCIETQGAVSSTLPKTLTVLGLSKSGMAVAEYAARRGVSVFLSELLPATPNNEIDRSRLEALQVPYEMGGHTKSVFTHATQVVVSPGIPPTSDVIQQLSASGVEIISEVELAYRENRTYQPRPSKLIAITGTNGKTTTTTLISEILKASGETSPACGNIGWPILSAMESSPYPDTLVAELSSFQLQFSPTLTADIAVFMNLTPDHINWHGSMENYQNAKLRLFTGAQSPQWVVINADDAVSTKIAEKTTANILWFSRLPESVAGKANWITLNDEGKAMIQLENQPPSLVFLKHQTQLFGNHNLDNLLAAAGAAFLHGIHPAVIQQVCEGFTGVEHRIEKVLTLQVNGQETTFYNDSKATNTDAAISAMVAFEHQPVVLIAGGRDKMEDLTRFSQVVYDHCTAVILIGEAKERFAQALESSSSKGENALPIVFAETMMDAVHQGLKFSQSGSEMRSVSVPVLFSPACSSFDWYDNFEKRGEAYKATVQQLAISLGATIPESLTHPGSVSTNPSDTAMAEASR